jgi:hypothetical protein
MRMAAIYRRIAGETRTVWQRIVTDGHVTSQDRP